MHEMSIAEGILGIVEKAARDQGFGKVKEIRLEIGALSGVEIEALKFSLDVVLNNSVAEGALVELETTPGSGWCMICGETVPINALYDACPQCGGYQVQATGGTEMRVKDLLVE
jgi:hydrogenase nickel incorporation protein HypA/HybF